MENFGQFATTGPNSVPQADMPESGVPADFLPPEPPTEFSLDNDLENAAMSPKPNKAGKIIAIVLLALVVVATGLVGATYWAKGDDQSVAKTPSRKPVAEEEVGGIDSWEEPKSDDEKDEVDKPKEETPADKQDEPKTDETKPEEKPEQKPEQNPGVTTAKTLKVKLAGNGAQIGATELSCKTNGVSCTVKMPSIAREGGEVIGWATDQNATEAQYGVGDQVEVRGGETFYAVSAKTYTATFVKRDATSIGATELKCRAYNTATSCEVIMPAITRTNGLVLGWAMTKTATLEHHKVGDKVAISSNRSFYAITRAK